MKRRKKQLLLQNNQRIEEERIELTVSEMTLRTIYENVRVYKY